MSQIIYRPREETTEIILHDSHTVPGRIDEVRRWAELAYDGALKMGYSSIGYHFIIEHDGMIVEAREAGLIGSHTPGRNMKSIGICLVGGRDFEGGPGVNNFTEAQYKSLLALIKFLDNRYGKELKVYGHSEIQKFRNRSLPPCPPLDMDEVREDVNLFKQGLYIHA